jgi:hypothetical protein
LAETAERVSGIWFKPGADVRQAAQKAARERAATSDPAAAPAPDAEADGERREAAFLVPPLTWSHLQIEAALMQCLGKLGPMSAEVVPLAPHAYGGCGTPAPVLLRSLGANQKVALDPPLLVNCPIVAALHQWLEDKVQPAARFISPGEIFAASLEDKGTLVLRQHQERSNTARLQPGRNHQSDLVCRPVATDTSAVCNLVARRNTA